MSRKKRPAEATRADPDARKGALEGDRPNDPQDSNPNAGALDEDGLPPRMQPICEDAIGANADNNDRARGVAGEAVVATETGQSPADNDKPR